MMFWGCQNFKTSSLVSYFWKMSKLGWSDEMYYAATIRFSKNVEFVHCNYQFFIFANEYMMFGGCRNFKTSSLVLYFWKISKNLGGSDEMYYTATIQFSKNVQFVHCNYHKCIVSNEQMLFGGCRNFKTSSLVSYFWKMSKFRWKRWNVLCSHYTIF